MFLVSAAMAAEETVMAPSAEGVQATSAVTPAEETVVIPVEEKKVVETAPAEEAPKFLTLDVSSEFDSGYLLDSGWKVGNGSASQSDIHLSLVGFYGDFWISRPLNGKTDGRKEIDYAAGWAGPIGYGFDVDIKLAYFACQDIEVEDEESGEVSEICGDILQPSVEVGREFALSETHSLRPFVRMEFPMPVKSGGPERGVYTHFGATHTWTISPSLTFTQTVKAIADDGVYGAGSGFVGMYGAALSYDLYKGLTITPSIKATTPFSVVDERKSEIVGGIGLSYSYSL